jgi:DeoR/GlpR family transcriptional regulator of sugar metabolism
MPKYLVETISMFRIRYVVEAACAEHAKDEVCMNDAKLSEFSQLHIDEIITSTREINTEEYLRIFDEDNKYLEKWSNAKKLDLVNVIDYDAP